MSPSKLQSAIDRLLREKSDETNMIETLWLLFAASVEIPTGGVQWVESRRCFFAGAATLFEAIMRILEPGEDATEADLARMERIAKELERYQREVGSGLA